MAGIGVFPRVSGRTFLAIFALISIVFGSMALVIAQPVKAATVPAVLALTEECPSDLTQILWAGSLDTVLGNVHSNAGMRVSGSENHVSGTVTVDENDCGYLNSGSLNTGGLADANHAGTIADPGYLAPTECRFAWTGTADVDLNNEDEVWEDDGITLKTGNYCHLGTGKLQQSRQFGNGTVSFFANGNIDLAAGSDVDYSPFRTDGVLLHSKAEGDAALTVAGSNSFYRGILYSPNGNAEGAGQNNIIGCLVGDTVKIDGSNNTIGSNCGAEPPPDPTITIVKSNDTEPDGTVNPGDSVEFTLEVTITNSNGEDVTIVDEVPEGFDDPAPADLNGGTFNGGGDPPGDGGTITWTLEGPGDGPHFLTYTLTVSESITEQTTLTNVATVTYPGSNCPPPDVITLLTELPDECDDDSTVVVVIPPPPDPLVEIVKENNTEGPVQPGDSVDFTLTVTVTDSNGEDVTVEDFIPAGFDDPEPTDIQDGGSFDGGGDPAGDGGVITWVIDSPGDGEIELNYTLTVSESITEDTELENTAFVTQPGSNCPPLVTDGAGTSGVPQDDPCNDDSTVIVDVPPLEPSLVIDKVADTETITISGPADAPVANPSVVTWTLTYTVTNGPVDLAIITDEVPEGFVFLDASDGGTEAGGVVTWNLGTIDTSGSVSFRTTVDAETIDRSNPTVNVAVIDSAQTEPDEGEDSVTVSVEPPPLGGNPTPSPSVPDTAFGIGIGGELVSVPLELLVVVFIGSLGALTAANLRAWNRRR